MRRVSLCFMVMAQPTLESIVLPFLCTGAIGAYGARPGNRLRCEDQGAIVRREGGKSSKGPMTNRRSPAGAPPQ